MRKVELSLKENLKYQINRLIAGYKEFGKDFFVHGNRGRKPKHALTNEFKDEIENLYTSKYFDCTYTQFSEYLSERENIFLSVLEVGQILREKYILSPRSRKVTKKNIKKKLLAQKENSKSKKEIAKIQTSIVAIEDSHPRQPRCIYFGEEIQTDACIHLWFGNIKTALHAAIDDSTGIVVAAYFDNQETLNGYYNIYYQILTKYGIPYLFKTDKRTVFEYNKKGTTSDEDNTFTQFAYACNQLGTSIECSSVPEFKPRIERLFESFQLRLIPELRLANITTIEDSIFAFEEIPEVQTYSENFDTVLPTENKKIYIPKMIHP